MVVGNNELTTMKNEGESLAISIAMRMWWCNTGHIARRPMEHIQGITRRIAAAATMVDEFVETTQNSNKTQLLASKRTLYSAH